MVDALTLQRVAHALHKRGLRLPARAITTVGRLVFAAYLPPETEIGEGSVLGYGGIGVIVHARAVIGKRVLLSPGVVVGGRSELEGVPVIEDDVRIGAGAKVLGPIRIGAGARIGANAVVLTDVAPGDVVVGIPARSIRKNGSAAKERAAV